MSVQTIFKTLIGTAFLIVFSALMIEIFNLNISMHQMRNLTQLSLNKSCDLFAQETYKTDSSSHRGAGDLATIYAADGSEYVSGNIYPGDTPEEIWNALYKNGSSFTSFKNMNILKNGSSYKWYSMDIMNMAVTGAYVGAVAPSLGASDAQINAYNKKMFAKAYAENLYTPLNIGITFLDKPTVQKIFRWNLTKLLTNGYDERILKDEAGNYYVQYNGFRCYANEATVNITYEVYQLDDKGYNAQFAAITGIGNPNAANKGDLGIATDSAFIQETMGIASDERKYVCLAKISYTMPVAYEGISPIKEIFEFAFKNEVQGLNTTTPNVADQTWNYNKENLSGGGVNGAYTTPTSGNIYYYVVR